MNRKRNLLTLIAILMALVVGAALNNILHLPSVQAYTPLTIPKSYGTLKATMRAALILRTPPVLFAWFKYQTIGP